MATDNEKLIALKKDLEVYNKELPNLLANEGKYVLIFKQEIIDTFDSYEDALKEGYKKAGLEIFLVKKIQSVERIHSFTRHITPIATLHTTNK